LYLHLLDDRREQLQQNACHEISSSIIGIGGDVQGIHGTKIYRPKTTATATTTDPDAAIFITMFAHVAAVVINFTK
jgi:hypothetical protein